MTKGGETWLKKKNAPVRFGASSWKLTNTVILI
jgi:hypothetical protein